MAAYLLEVYTTTSGVPTSELRITATCDQHAMMQASEFVRTAASGALWEVTPTGLRWVDSLGLVSQP